MKNAAEDRVVACESCARTIERCRVCADDSCQTPMCYRCLILDSGQSFDQPHPHGG